MAHRRHESFGLQYLDRLPDGLDVAPVLSCDLVLLRQARKGAFGLVKWPAKVTMPGSADSEHGHSRVTQMEVITVGTDGFMGFAIDGTLKITFVSGDSYPAGLGDDVLAWLTKHQTPLRSGARKDRTDPLIERIRAIRVIDVDGEVTTEDWQLLQERHDPSAGQLGPGDPDDLYNYLLWRTHGDLDAVVEYGLIPDSSDRPLDSLGTEWGYLIDLDAGTFEVYVGGQRAPHDKGRFAHLPTTSHDYYPMALEASWPLDGLPTRTEFIAVLGEH